YCSSSSCLLFSLLRLPPRSTLFPYTTLFRNSSLIGTATEQNSLRMNYYLLDLFVHTTVTPDRPRGATVEKTPRSKLSSNRAPPRETRLGESTPMAARKAGTATPDTMTDPVDWAHHYWQEQGLQGDEQRFLAMSSLLRYQRLVVDAVEEALRAHRLNLTDYLVL